jgi:hypothetical protein
VPTADDTAEVGARRSSLDEGRSSPSNLNTSPLTEADMNTGFVAQRPAPGTTASVIADASAVEQEHGLHGGARKGAGRPLGSKDKRPRIKRREIQDPLIKGLTNAIGRASSGARSNRSRARACLDLLEDPLGSSGKDLLECNGSSAGSAIGAPSAHYIARVLVRDVEAVLAEAGMRAFSLTLTARPMERVDLEAKVRSFVSVVGRRWPRASLFLALDRASQWHVHGLAVVPATLDLQDLLRAWRHLWPWGERPSPDAQHVTPLEGKRAELVAVLVHHLRGPRRAGLKGPDIHPMPARIFACGALAPALERLRPWMRGEVAVPPPARAERAPPARKGLADAIALGPARLSKICAWCGKALATGTHRHARFHEGCSPSASRALSTAKARVVALVPRWLDRVRGGDSAGFFVHWVDKLEQKHRWLRRDALRVAESIVIDTDMELSDALEVPQCACGQPLAHQLNAKTCGRAACRGRRGRMQKSPAKEHKTEMTIAEPKIITKEIDEASFVPDTRVIEHYARLERMAAPMMRAMALADAARAAGREEAGSVTN